MNKFSEKLSKIPTFLSMKMHLKISSAKWRQCCLNTLSIILIITEQITSANNNYLIMEIRKSRNFFYENGSTIHLTREGYLREEAIWWELYNLRRRCIIFCCKSVVCFIYVIITDERTSEMFFFPPTAIQSWLETNKYDRSMVWIVDRSRIIQGSTSMFMFW